MAVALALMAMLAELATGYPDRLYKAIGHPVTWIGAVISRAEKRWNTAQRTDTARFAAGLGLLVALVAGSLLIGLLLQTMVDPLGIAGFLLLAIAMGTLIAQRSLYTHVAAVADALERGGLEAGRKAVSQIVGRDPQALDEAGVARAAIESLAENFSDGIVAPVFWLAALGPAGTIAYKAVNTADSMIGHRNERYEQFGKAAARFDDVINLPASRLSALFVAAGALTMKYTSPRNALRAVRRDARHHRSPNAGWPEAAMAGALGIGLAGPRAYGGVMTSDRVMNEGGRRDLTAADIRRALTLYVRANEMLIGLLAVLALALWWIQ